MEEVNPSFIESHIEALVELMLIIVVTFLCMKLIDFLINRIKDNIKKRHENNARLLSFCSIASKTVKVTILFIIIASVMQAHGYSMTSLITGFGILGMAVSFAAKETIANIFGSITILYDNVFELGDYIELNGVEGYVHEISLRSTKIRTFDNSIITLPNNIVANAIIENYSHLKKRRIDEVIGITYDTPDEKIDRALEILKKIIENNPETETNPNLIYLEKLNSSSIDIHLEAYVKHGDLSSFRRVRQSVLKEIIKLFRQEGIEFAFPSQSLYIEKNEN